MDPARILITGANGQLGTALRKRYPAAIATDSADLDITDPDSLFHFDWSKVDVIINAAAYTNVDGAETPEGKTAAMKVNADGPANLARIATDHDLTLVHISSEYVFDGTRSPHTEDEPMSPLGAYAKSKAAGDEAVTKTPKHYILRVSWLIGEGHNFVRTMAGLAEKNISPKVVDDQIGRLTFTKTVVDGINLLLKDHAPYGIYNLTNDGEPASWAEVTKEIFHLLGRDDLTVTPISTEDYFKDKPEAAPRPLQSTLDLTKIEALGLQIPDWHDALKGYLTK